MQRGKGEGCEKLRKVQNDIKVKFIQVRGALPNIAPLATLHLPFILPRARPFSPRGRDSAHTLLSRLPVPNLRTGIVIRPP